MRKAIIWTTLFSLLLCLAVPCFGASADITIEAPQGRELGKSTSIEPVITADCGKQLNADKSKNAALIAPIFGSAESYLPGSGELLTLNLQTNHLLIGTTIQGTGNILPPPAALRPQKAQVYKDTFTKVTSNLYYGSGTSKYLGTLRIPNIDVNVRIYQGTDNAALAKGAGHFTDTSIWNGNVCLAGHNRGTNCYFGDIHLLTPGEKINLTTKLGARTYEVTSVEKIKETDNSKLARTTENCITLYTCVRNEKEYRWCVRAVEAL